MRIIIKSPGEKTIKILFPTRLIFNNLTATIGARAISKYVKYDNDINISGKDMRRFVRELNRMKKKYPNLNLVDVEDADGDIVKIQL